VATRIQTYGLVVSGPADAYARHLLLHEAVREWIDAGVRETFRDAPHEASRLVRRGLRLVNVGAGREREQLHDAADDRRRAWRGRAVRAGRRKSGRGRVDAARAAHLGERGSVRRLVVDAHRLVDVLVRELVLEHLAHRAVRTVARCRQEARSKPRQHELVRQRGLSTGSASPPKITNRNVSFLRVVRNSSAWMSWRNAEGVWFSTVTRSWANKS
jgi:hypothetical protein